MAALHVFQPFVDKENPIEGGSGIARLKSRGAVPRNLPGKTFQTPNAQSTLQTPVRRALGDVNRSDVRKFGGQPLQLKQPTLKAKHTLSFNPPNAASKPNKVKGQKQPKCVQRPRLEASETFRLPPPIVGQKFIYEDDIETMPIPVEQEDDFEGIWSVVERPATYIEPLKMWRSWPFSHLADDCENTNDCLLSDEDEVLLEVPILDLTLEEQDLSMPYSGKYCVPSLADIPLPSYEDLQLHDEDLFTMLC